MYLVYLVSNNERIGHQQYCSRVQSLNHSSKPNMLTTATGRGRPSLIFVWPQYATTCLEGCHVTVSDGANAGTRWRGAPVSVEHLFSSILYAKKRDIWLQE